MTKSLKKYWLAAVLGIAIIALAAPALAEETALNAVRNISLAKVVKNVLDFLIGGAGLVSVIFLIYGGFAYMTSAGEEKKAAHARSILTSAVIGLFIILLSYALVHFVVSRFINIQLEINANVLDPPPQ